ncbi:MAG: protease modulator HflC [Gammaproteobacteria bacterium]|nr:protease modulator HflC [Gammaproteobacteria bacterium]MDH5651015.1 protease modulator HflC [Gammaproteobacteria bacterium]
MGSLKMPLLLLLVVFGFVFLSTVFTVDERELAIKFRLGEIVKTDYEPGLHFQIPFVNNIRKFPKLILTLDARPALYLTKEKKNVNVDFFVKWRIKDVATYYKSMSGGNERIAAERIYTIINDGLRDEFSKRTIQEVISGERRELMDSTTQVTNKQIAKFGIEVVDVRVKRIDYPEQISDSIYRRMEAERARVAKELRSQGAETAERIKAESDRKRTVILADAYSQSQKIRGTGDAKASEIYAKAYSKNPEFYSFYRSLDAYRSALGQDDDILVLEPDSEFFDYFKSKKAR